MNTNIKKNSLLKYKLEYHSTVRRSYLLSILLIFGLLASQSLNSQDLIEKEILTCSNDCVQIGKEQVKKNTYSWVLNGSGLEKQTPTIEICKPKNGDYYTLREITKNGKLVKDTRYKIVVRNQKNIKIAPIDPCVLNGEPASVTVIGDYKKYKWSTGETSKSIIVNSDEPIKVEVVDENNCLISRKIKIKKEASNDIRKKLLKEGFQEIPIEIIKKNKKGE